MRIEIRTTRDIVLGGEARPAGSVLGRLDIPIGTARKFPLLLQTDSVEFVELEARQKQQDGGRRKASTVGSSAD